MSESSVDTQTIRQLIDVSRVWLGIGEKPRVVLMKSLDENLVLNSLKEGIIAECGDWTIKATPPRRVGAPGGESEWAPGILAVSVHGLASGLRIDIEGVRQVFRHVREIEQRRAARLQEGLEAEQHYQQELDED